MKVFVLGSTGMLGRYVYCYFKQQGFDVIGTDRAALDATKADNDMLDALGAGPGDIFINCIGVIKQRGDVAQHEFILVNSAFPIMLADYCQEKEIKLIHVTTDCVFDGRQGRYQEEEKHTATDIYGRSKSFGEPPNAAVIRTSIIGEELENKVSLLEWVKSNKDQSVDGYINHRWNGITCLQFAKVCEEMVNNNFYWQGVRHIHSPDDINKADLVHLISNVYKLNVTVNPTMSEGEPVCDRTLSSIFLDGLSSIPTIEKQLLEQRNFNISDCGD